MVPDLQRAVIEVFGGCNYTCQMCPQTNPGRGKEWTRKMPLPLFEKILDELPGKPVINLEGSGESTMAKDLPKYIEACTKRGFDSYIYTNGLRLQGHFMKDCIDAGLSHARFSVIGYDKKTYKEWMDADNFETIRANILECTRYGNDNSSRFSVSTYSLVLDNSKIDFEVEQYRKNLIDFCDVTGYIWKMHNWSGNYEPGYERKKSNRRTCGRPFSPEIVVRAGGNNGHRAAVTPCCQTLGPPNEAKSVLGHLDSQSLDEVWNGELYNELRQNHKTKNFDAIDYCKNCDFLYDDPEVLVWSNDPKAETNHMLGTNFSLKEYM